MLSDVLFMLTAFIVGLGVGSLCNCPMVFGLLFKLSNYQSLQQSLEAEQQLPVQSALLPILVLCSLTGLYLMVGFGPAAMILTGLLSGNLVSFMILIKDRQTSP